MKRFLFTCVIVLAGISRGVCENLADVSVRPGVALYAETVSIPSLSGILAASVIRVRDVFMDMGRFYPANGRDLETEKENLDNEADADTGAARRLGCDLCVRLKCSGDGRNYYLLMTVIPLREEYRSLAREIRLHSRVPLNLPALAAREIAFLHENIPLKITVTGRKGDDATIIDAGQWHGLRQGTFRLEGGGTIEVLRCGRYAGVCRISPERKEDSFLVDILPDVKPLIRLIEDDIDANTHKRYSIDDLIPGSDPGQRFVEALCIINPGANLCLPGYGASLATGYLGFQNPRYDAVGITVSTATVFLHFMTPVFATGFRGNFAPWIQDPDKPDPVYRFGIYAWATVPMAYSAAFLDSLAVQYKAFEKLPPFFRDRDTAACVLSFLVPGGGLFYKGHRMTGWVYYFTEIPLGAAGCWMGSGKGAIVAFSLLGSVKVIDMVHAFFVEPSYGYYTREYSRGEISTLSLTPGISMSPAGEPVVRLGLTMPLMDR